MGGGKLENRAGQEVLGTVARDLVLDPLKCWRELFMKISVAVELGNT